MGLMKVVTHSHEMAGQGLMSPKELNKPFDTMGFGAIDSVPALSPCDLDHISVAEHGKEWNSGSSPFSSSSSAVPPPLFALLFCFETGLYIAQAILQLTSVAKDGFELLIILPLLPKDWYDDRPIPPYPD